MSIFQKKTVIATYPAYDVVTLEPQSQKGDINLKAGDKLITPEHLNKYMISSVVSSVLEDGGDPIAAFKRAIEFKHPTHFIIALASVLSSHKQEKQFYIQVEIGMLVNFEGHTFKVTKQNNNNLGLQIV